MFSKLPNSQSKWIERAGKKDKEDEGWVLVCKIYISESWMQRKTWS